MAKGLDLASPSERSERFEPLVRLGLESDALSVKSTIANFNYLGSCE